MLRRQSEKRSGRRVILFLGLIMLTVWGLGTANFMRGCEGGERSSIPRPEGEDIRTQLMLEDSIERFSGATSFSYMYMTGRTWAAGETARPGRVNQRVIVGPAHLSPEYEIRSIGDELWWRSRGGDRWHATDPPEVVSDVIDPRALTERSTALVEDARDLVFHGAQRVFTPLETWVEAHRISGMTTVRSVRHLGLGTVSDADGDLVIRSDYWIDRETGVPARIVFHGVPPALPPLGILHLFEVDELEVDTIMAPPPEALAENIARVVEERLAAMQEAQPKATDVKVTDDLMPLTEASRLEVIASVASGDDAGIAVAVEAEPTEPEPQTAAVTSDAESFYVESASSPQEGWLTLVVPMEGYSLQVPDTWRVDQHSSSLNVSGPDGWSLSVRLHPGRNSLLGLAEIRLGSCEARATMRCGSQ